MTQSNPTLGLGLPIVARRLPNGGYRAVQLTGTATYGTTRVCGMWVPAEAFRRGTQITVDATVGASAGLTVRIGGDGSSVGLGVSVATTTNGAAVCGIRDVLTQRDEGCIVNFDSAGFHVGSAVAAAVTTAATVVFIQPLNFVELVTGASVAVQGAVMTLMPPPTVFEYGHSRHTV